MFFILTTSQRSLTTLNGLFFDIATSQGNRTTLNRIFRVSKSCDRATARSRKNFQRSRKIWVFDRKNAQFTTVLPFWVTFPKILLLFGPFCLRKTFEQKYWSRKTNCF